MAKPRRRRPRNAKTRTGQEVPSDYVKKSGCSIHKMEGGDWMVYGWHADAREGMVTMRAFPTKGASVKVSETGKKWLQYTCWIRVGEWAKEVAFSGLFDTMEHKLYIKELNKIGNPKGGPGGYFGKHVSSDM